MNINVNAINYLALVVYKRHCSWPGVFLLNSPSIVFYPCFVLVDTGFEFLARNPEVLLHGFVRPFHL